MNVVLSFVVCVSMNLSNKLFVGNYLGQATGRHGGYSHGADKQIKIS